MIQSSKASKLLAQKALSYGSPFVKPRLDSFASCQATRVVTKLRHRITLFSSLTDREHVLFLTPQFGQSLNGTFVKQ